MYHLIFLLLVMWMFGCAPPATLPDITPEIPPQRIISTLPSITEVLFDIGLGDRIIGDSAFTKYPPEAASIEKIGGLHDVNREKIISLRPDLVIVSIENTTLRSSLNVPVLTVDHRTLKGVLDSYIIIGTFFGEEVLVTAQKKQQKLLDRLNYFEKKTKDKIPIKTLICISRSHGMGQIQNMVVAGADSFLSDVVTRAGGKNVAAATGLLAPQLSTEGLIYLAPDVIIDLQIGGIDPVQGLSDWQSLGNRVPAVKNRRILILSDDFASIPGPRTPMLIEKITRYFESLEF